LPGRRKSKTSWQFGEEEATMMALSWVVLLTGAYPLGRAWWANRETTLVYAVGWAAAAWATWAVTVLLAWLRPEADPLLARYLALCLTGCAAVAVLGARRPGVGIWNFVVLGLLVVLILPVALGLGTLRLEWHYMLLLTGTLAVGVLNYLPTRLGPVALLLAAGCAIELANVLPPDSVPESLPRALPVGHFLLAVVPWAAFVQLRWRTLPPAEFDRLWLAYRDRFGFVWGQRLREQFNRAAANAGWPVLLRWTGLRILPEAAVPGPAVQEAIVATLRALLKRFGQEAK
jgi:hypothetical protein